MNIMNELTHIFCWHNWQNYFTFFGNVECFASTVIFNNITSKFEHFTIYQKCHRRHNLLCQAISDIYRLGTT